jgi:chromosome partitioning protein
MPKIVSFINLKGGVGKTTLTVNLAANLARKYDKRVLVIDLDPQTNATVSLITQPQWDKINTIDKQTLYYLFKDKLDGTSNFDINKAIQKNVGGVKNLDLVPSSLDLVEIQDIIPDIGTKAFINHIDVIGTEIEGIKANYDYILIDCPPNLGAITLNGIVISDYYVIPTTPDILSKIGISLITKRIDKFISIKKTCKIKLAGIIFTKVDKRTNLHKSTKLEMRSSSYAYSTSVFKNELPQRISIAEAPVDNRPHLSSKTSLAKREWTETQGLIDCIVEEFLTKTP